MRKLTKDERVAEANRVIQIISEHGRRFFYAGGRTSRFYVDHRGKVWFIDKWTGKHVYTHYNGRWRHFSEGGTLRSLVIALRDFIRTGEPISHSWFGPWPALVCVGDLWGYGDSMEAVRKGVLETAAVANRSLLNQEKEGQ